MLGVFVGAVVDVRVDRTRDLLLGALVERVLTGIALQGGAERGEDMRLEEMLGKCCSRWLVVWLGGCDPIVLFLLLLFI